MYIYSVLTYSVLMILALSFRFLFIYKSIIYVAKECVPIVPTTDAQT